MYADRQVWRLYPKHHIGSVESLESRSGVEADRDCAEGWVFGVGFFQLRENTLCLLLG